MHFNQFNSYPVFLNLQKSMTVNILTLHFTKQDQLNTNLYTKNETTVK